MKARRELGRELRAHYDSAIAPHWPRIRSAIDSEATRYARVLATRGLEYFLNSLHPELHWSPPVLTMSRTPEIVTDVYPEGRGLVIVPSVFSRRLRINHPTAACGSPVTIIVPVTHSIALAQHLAQPETASGNGSMSTLVGTTRAAVLDAASTGCTTTELARRTGVSPATASYHAAVLRDAGLIQTQRFGSAVLHTVTSLGANLLNGVLAREGDDKTRPQD